MIMKVQNHVDVAMEIYGMFYSVIHSTSMLMKLGENSKQSFKMKDPLSANLV